MAETLLKIFAISLIICTAAFLCVVGSAVTVKGMGAAALSAFMMSVIYYIVSNSACLGKMMSRELKKVYGDYGPLSRQTLEACTEILDVCGKNRDKNGIYMVEPAVMAAAVFETMGLYDEALNYMLRVDTARLREHSGYAEFAGLLNKYYMELLSIYMNLNDKSSAEAVYNEARSFFDKETDEIRRAAIELSDIQYLNFMGMPQDALEKAEKCDIPYDDIMLGVKISRCNSLALLDRFDEAAAAASDILDRYDRFPDRDRLCELRRQCEQAAESVSEE